MFKNIEITNGKYSIIPLVSQPLNFLFHIFFILFAQFLVNYLSKSKNQAAT